MSLSPPQTTRAVSSNVARIAAASERKQTTFGRAHLCPTHCCWASAGMAESRRAGLTKEKTSPRCRCHASTSRSPRIDQIPARACVRACMLRRARADMTGYPNWLPDQRSPGIEVRCIMRNRPDHAGWWWVAAIAITLRNAGQTEARAKKL